MSLAPGAICRQSTPCGTIEMLAIIGGSGLTRLASLEVSHRKLAGTPYGEPSAALSFGRISDLSGRLPGASRRRAHGIPPHQVNYRANIWALAECGPVGIVAVAAVGSIRANLSPGDLVMPDQIIDYTWGRESTYHEGPERAVRHVDFTEPFDRSAAPSVWPGPPQRSVSTSLTRRSMPRRRARGWRRRPRSIGSSATVPTWSA
jgi:purine nucleoside phosphorylase